MDCPVCKDAMITLELKDVEIDYCTDCGGIWLDAGELELLLGEQQKAKQLLDSFKKRRWQGEADMPPAIEMIGGMSIWRSTRS